MVSFVVAGVIAMIVAHAFLAVRKFPINYRQFTLFRGHMKMLRHEDTTLWFWQALHRFRAVLPRRAACLHHADASGADRPLRIGRSRLDRSLLAALHPAAARGRAARRHRPLPAGRQVGLVRRSRPQGHATAAEDAQVGADGVLPGARVRDARRLHQDRHRARAELRPALRSRRAAGRAAGGGRNEGHLYRRPRDRRRARGPAGGDRRQAPRPRRDHPVAGAAQAVALGGGAGRHAGLARQRDQGPGRHRGRPLRGHGARQRLGRRPEGGPDVRQHGAQGRARAGGVGRAVEPRAQGRPHRHHQRPAGDDHRARRSARPRRAARFRRHQEMAHLLRLRRHRPRDAADDERPGDRRADPGARAHRGRSR